MATPNTYEAVTTDPDDLGLVAGRADVLAHMGRYADAIAEDQCYEDAPATARRDVWALHHRARRTITGRIGTGTQSHPADPDRNPDAVLAADALSPHTSTRRKGCFRAPADHGPMQVALSYYESSVGVATTMTSSEFRNGSGDASIALQRDVVLAATNPQPGLRRRSPPCSEWVPQLVPHPRGVGRWEAEPSDMHQAIEDLEAVRRAPARSKPAPEIPWPLALHVKCLAGLDTYSGGWPP